MGKQMTLNVRVNGVLSDFVTLNIGDAGSYENVSEYVRDLIRRDMERVGDEHLDRLKAELAHGFAASEDSFAVLDADSLIARNRQA